MGWLGRGLEGLRCTGEPVYELDGNNGYDGQRVRKVTIACEVSDPPSLTPGKRCNHERFTLAGWTDKPTAIRDRRLEIAPTQLLIHRRRLHCKACDSVLSERMPGVELGREMTRRLYDDLFHAAVNRPYEDAANLHGVSADLVEKIFRERARDILGDFQPELPTMIAIDETMLAGRMRFVCNCLVSRTLVEILPNKEPATIKSFLKRNSGQGHVEVVVQDMNGNYRALVREVLGPEVTIVIDRYHVIDALNRAMNKARVAVTSGKKGSIAAAKRRDLRKIGPLLLRNRREMTRTEWADLKEQLRAEPELKRAWMLKEGLKGLYGFKRAEQAAAKLDRLDKRYDVRWPPVMRPMGRALEMVREYEVEILNWHRVMQDNSFTESMNGRYQLIDAGRAGVRFETVRVKALLRYGGLLDQDYLDRV